MRKSLLFLAFALIFACGSVSAQQVVEITGMTGTYPLGDLTDVQLNSVSNPHVLTIGFDGTTAVGGPSGNFLTTNNFLIHGDANWQYITSSRTDLCLRPIDDPAGDLSPSVTCQHLGWQKAGNSGDPNFGNPGAATKEAVSFPTIPTITMPAGNASGIDTVGIQLGLTAASDAGWNPGINPVGNALTFTFETVTADDGKFICIDSVSQPLGAWQWAPIGGTAFGPDYDNGLGNGDTRCWEVYAVPNLGPDITNCPTNYSFSHCVTGQIVFEATDPDGPGVDPDGWVVEGTSTAGGSFTGNTWTWSGADPGNYTLVVHATDDASAPGPSCTVNVEVTNAPPTIECPTGFVTVPLDATKSQTVVTDDDCDLLTVSVIGYDGPLANPTDRKSVV